MNMEFKNWVFNSHMVGNIISVPKPLTANQEETLDAYLKRSSGDGKPLTDKQKETLIGLQHKLIESKKFKLSDGQKAILSEIVFYAKHGRKAILDNKYLSKGLEGEKDARDLLSKTLGIPLIADDERRQNDWVTGKRDIKLKDVIIDIKTKWDFTTFSKCLVENNNETYLRQLDCYMDLWGVKNSILAHILIDTPNHLIESDLRKLDWKHNILDMGGEVREEMIDFVKAEVSRQIYTRKGLESFCLESPNIKIDWFDDFVEIPEHERIHMVNHDFDPIRIEQRNECIKLAREYMGTVKPINNIIRI